MSGFSILIAWYIIILVWWRALLPPACAILTQSLSLLNRPSRSPAILRFISTVTLHHGFYCSPLLHLSGEEPSFSSKSVLLSTLTPWPLPYFTAVHSTTILLSHCLILSAPISSTSYYYATIHKCSLSFQPAYSTTICHKAIHLAASTYFLLLRDYA